jgi:hypothetical protein
VSNSEENTTRRETPSPIKFQYLTSSAFRVIHADGIFGGFTPQGNLFLNIFSEHAPLPDVTFHRVEENGALGPEIMEKRQGASDAVIREVEAGVSMNLDVAKAMLEWLRSRIEIAEKTQAELSSVQRGGGEKT